MSNFHIMDGYVINSNPSHHIDLNYTDEGQDEVYQFAKEILDKEKLNVVVDLGCGSGFKLIKYFDNNQTVGIETEPCLSQLKLQYPDKTWINSGEPEKTFSQYNQSCDILICADVVEHIIDPQELLNYIKTFDFKYLIISTPDRIVLRDEIPGYGMEAWVGPPKNPAHVREWEFNEFHNFLSETFNVVDGYHSTKQKECMFFLCTPKSYSEKIKKVAIISADFGTNEKYNFNIPGQVSNYIYEKISFDDQNTPSRSLSLHPRTKGKIPKMLQWMETDADYYIWLDSKFKIKSNKFINDIINYLGDSEMILFKHPLRSSIREECIFVIKGMQNKDEYLIDRYEGEKLSEQVNEYLKDETFIDDKLFALGIFAYSSKLIKNRDHNLMKDWFLHNCYWSIQDQLSIPYLLQKHKTDYKVFEFDLFSNEYVEYFQTFPKK